jgi:hypothetical protein
VKTHGAKTPKGVKNMVSEYKKYLLFRTIFPENTKYVVTNYFVGTKSFAELLTRLVVKEVKNEP